MTCYADSIPSKILRKQCFTVWEIWDVSQGFHGFENLWQVVLIVYLISKVCENKVSRWKLDLGNCGRFNWKLLAWWEYSLVWWVDCELCVVKFYYRVLIRFFTYLVSQDIMVCKHMSCKILNLRFVIQLYNLVMQDLHQHIVCKITYFNIVIKF
jgi:hypothetical protein